MTEQKRIDFKILPGYHSYEEWEGIIRGSGGLRACSSVYTVEFLRRVEIINAGWLNEGDNVRIRNYIARRMRKDGWEVEVSRAWDPGKGEFVCLEAVRPRDYCREHDPDYELPEALREAGDGI